MPTDYDPRNGVRVLKIIYMVIWDEYLSAHEKISTFGPPSLYYRDSFDENASFFRQHITSSRIPPMIGRRHR